MSGVNARLARPIASVAVALAALVLPAPSAPGQGPGALAGPVHPDSGDSDPRPPGNQGPPVEPNFVFIMADDLGWGDLACFGNQFVQTPCLDQLAQEGTRFTHFYVGSPVCSPTRASVMTGQFPSRLRIHSAFNVNPVKNAANGMDDWLDPVVPTVTSILNDAGYATGCFGKWHLGATPGAPNPGAYGIDDHVTVDSTGITFPQLGQPDFWPRLTTYIVDETIQFIEQNQDVPFYVNVWPQLPHATLNPTEEQLAVYDYLAPEGVPYAGARQVYYAAVTALDAEICRLLDTIDQLGLAGNTIVVFTSDNGPQNINTNSASHSGIGSPGPFRGMKWSLYEGGIRMPLIVRWPGQVPAGVVDNDSVICAVDFLPTFCALAGIDPPCSASLPPGTLDGEDVSDMLLGMPRPRTTSLMWEWRFGPNRLRTLHRSPMLAIRSGQWKLLLNPDLSRVELYDVVTDPMEVDNRANARPDIVSQLSTDALAWQAALPAGPVDDEAGTADYPWP
jgi:N-acetylgalactosamine-6-sulfatase